MLLAGVGAGEAAGADGLGEKMFGVMPETSSLTELSEGVEAAFGAVFWGVACCFGGLFWGRLE